MPLAKNLGAARCEQILAELVEVTGQRSGRKLGIHCPWHKESTPGACWYDPEEDRAVCYGCQNHGDLVDIFCAKMGHAEGSREGIRAFFDKYAPDTKLERPAESPRRAPASFSARETVPPAADWQSGAAEWVEKCAGRLHGAEGAAAREQLARWGISPAMAAVYKIGWQPEDRFVRFTQWGLPYAENSKGRERCIHLPAGLVFPCFYATGDHRGAVQRVKVRLAAPRPDEPKYKAIVGGDTGYAVFGEPGWRVWFVVETERDAMLLADTLAAYEIGVMANGNASLPPDATAHAILDRAHLVVNALDNDAAGQRASWLFGASGRRFAWSEVYPHAIRWLVPSSVGKDVGDFGTALTAGTLPGLSLLEWALAALPDDLRRALEARRERRMAAIADAGADAGAAAAPTSADEEVF